MRDGDSGTSAALTLSGARRERLPDACDGHKHAADGYASAVAPADGSGMFCSSGTAATVGKLARCAAGAAGAATAAAAGTGALSLTTAGAGALHTAAIGTTPRESQSVCHSFTSEAALMTGSTDGLPSCQQLQQHQGNPPRCAAGSSCSSASLPTRTSACGRGVKRSRSSSSAPSALMGFTLLLTAALQGAVLMSGVPCAAAWGWPFSGSSSSSTSGGGGSRGSSSRSSSAAAARSAGSGSLSSLSSAKNSGRRTAALTASSDRVRSTRSSSSGTTVGGVKPQREAVSGGGAVWREPDPVLQAAGLREAPYNSAARDVAALLASDPTDTDTDPGSKDAATALSLDASRPADYRLPLNDAQSLLRQMLEEEEARRALPYNLTKPYKLPAASYEDEHFVFATGSYPDRYLLAQVRVPSCLSLCLWKCAFVYSCRCAGLRERQGEIKYMSCVWMRWRERDREEVRGRCGESGRKGVHIHIACHYTNSRGRSPGGSSAGDGRKGRAPDPDRIDTTQHNATPMPLTGHSQLAPRRARLHRHQQHTRRGHAE